MELLIFDLLLSLQVVTAIFRAIRILAFETTPVDLFSASQILLNAERMGVPS